MIKQFILFVFFVFVIFGFANAQQSRCMPNPPANVKQSETLRSPLSEAGTEVLIQNVPSYIWLHGCGPTALGMVIGYYDALGFSDLVVGNSDTQTDNVNAMIANDVHYADYSFPEDTPPNLKSDKSELGGAHQSNCLADFMFTSWSSEQNYYGWSWSNDINNSFDSYIPFINSNYWYFSDYEWFSATSSWAVFKNEIDNNRPVVLLVDSDGDGYTDHFVTGIGYDETSATYAIYNTWDHSVHWFSWHGLESGNAWGIYGFSTFSLKFSITATSSGNGTVVGDGYFYANQQVALVASAEEGSHFVNWTENGIEVSNSTTYSFTATANRALQANFEENPSVPVNLDLSSLNIVSDSCFNATNNITIAQNAPVTVQPNASATFIAGQSIRFLPGFHAQSGSYVSAYITTDGSFCDMLPQSLAQNVYEPEVLEKSVILENNEVSLISQGLKVYPNPTNGMVTIVMEDFGDQKLLEIANISGQTVYKQIINYDKINIDISAFNKGLYIVTCSDRFTRKAQRVVLN